MRLQNNFTDLQTKDNKTLEADIICECGCRKFTITHTGKSSLFNPQKIKKKSGQLLIKAECRTCHRLLTIYDSKIDGTKPKNVLHEESKPFTNGKNSVVEINVKYNFKEENFMTDKFKKMSITFKDDEKTYKVY